MTYDNSIQDVDSDPEGIKDKLDSVDDLVASLGMASKFLADLPGEIARDATLPANTRKVAESVQGSVEVLAGDLDDAASLLGWFRDEFVRTEAERHGEVMKVLGIEESLGLLRESPMSGENRDSLAAAIWAETLPEPGRTICGQAEFEILAGSEVERWRRVADRAHAVFLLFR